MVLFNPLMTAWHMLSHNPNRFFLSCLGIAFAVVIMFIQMGFFNGLIDSQSNLPPIFDADLIMSHKEKNHLKSGEDFSLKRLQQALSVDEVISVSHLYANATYWWNPQDGSRNRVLILAVSLDNPGIKIPEIEIFKSELKKPHTILFDRLSRKELGNIQIGTKAKLGVDTVETIGLFNLGANFTYEGHIITSHENYYRIFAHKSQEELIDLISLGLLKIKEGANPIVVKNKLLNELPNDFIVLTRDEIESREKIFTIKSSPAGIIFGIGLIVALVIGVIICYQILFNEINDHLSQFATLKAIGYKANYIFFIVFYEALLLAINGFIPGLLASYLLFMLVEHFTQIIMHLTPIRVLFIFMLTLIMTQMSAALAIRKVISADPADLF